MIAFLPDHDYVARAKKRHRLGDIKHKPARACNVRRATPVCSRMTGAGETGVSRINGAQSFTSTALSRATRSSSHPSSFQNNAAGDRQRTKKPAFIHRYGVSGGTGQAKTMATHRQYNDRTLTRLPVNTANRQIAGAKSKNCEVQLAVFVGLNESATKRKKSVEAGVSGQSSDIETRLSPTPKEIDVQSARTFARLSRIGVDDFRRIYVPLLQNRLREYTFGCVAQTPF